MRQRSVSQNTADTSYTGRMRRGDAVCRRVWIGVTVVAATAVVGPLSAAHAHDELIDTVPADGVEVDAQPGDVRLEFSGEIAPVGTVVEITGPFGEVTDGEPEINGTDVIQPLIADVPPGDYSVAWRVTSADGHAISGEFGYEVASAGLEAQSTPTGDDASQTSTDPDSAAESATPLEGGTDRAANTAAELVRGENSDGSGTALWVWGVLALALLTLGGLGTVAVRRR